MAAIAILAGFLGSNVPMAALQPGASPPERTPAELVIVF
jgi:hypothetical protein